MKSLVYRLKINYQQKLILNTLSNEHRLLYSYLLPFIKCSKNIDFKIINQEYKNFRNKNNLTIQSKVAQNTCKKLINSIKSFYSLRKKDISAKFPYKFKSWKYFTTMEFDYNKGRGGFKINNNELVIFLDNKSRLKNRYLLRIKLNDYCKKVTCQNIKTLIIKKIENRYTLIFVYSEEKKILQYKKEKIISIDPGVSNIVTVYNQISYLSNNSF